MGKKAHERGVSDDPHDPIDPFAWGLLFAVIEGSRLWHDRRRAPKKGNDPRVTVGVRNASPRPPLLSLARRTKA